MYSVLSMTTTAVPFSARFLMQLRNSRSPDGKRELSNTTLRSIAFNYIDRKGPSPPKSLIGALNHLKRQDDDV